MELKAQYDLEDLLGLVEQDLSAKGFRLVGGLEPDIAGVEKILLTLAIEQFTFTTTAPVVSPAPDQEPVKSVSVSVSEDKDEKRKAVLKKARAKYAEKKKVEKLAQEHQQQVAEVVAPTTVPFQFSQNALSSNGHNR